MRHHQFVSRGRWGPGPCALVLALGLSLAGASALAAQTGTITGLVRDAVNLQPLPGAQVSVEGAGIGGLANNVGRFLLLNVPAGQQTLTATLIGYGTVSQSVTVTPGESTTVDLVLREEALALEGVVVTGTAGTARRREIGNQISQLSAADIEVAAITDLGDILQGRTTGVQINDFGGQVGGGSQIRLRGNTSLDAGNDPLIYIDGIRMEANAIEVDGEAGASASALDMVNPNDIERIEIVKGPAATTLYGTEASGGVIQIFTKRGTSGAPAWTLDVDQGLRVMGHQGGSLNGEDINPTGFGLNDCTVRREFDGASMQFVTIPVDDPGAELGCPESGSWFQRGYMQRYNLSVRGGGETATYFVSGRFDDEEGVVDPQGARSYGVRANVAFQPFDGLDISMNNSFQRRTITWVPDGNNASGFLLNVMRGSADYTSGNDALVFENDLVSNINQYQTSASIGWTPNDDWTHRVNVGLDYTVQDYLDWKHWNYFTAQTGFRRNDHDQDRNITFDYTGSFAYNPVETISSRLSFGGQLYEEANFTLWGQDDSFAGPGEPEIGDGTNRDSEETRTRVRSGGFFVQEQLGWRDRLFVTGGVRWDGFSTFGEGFGIAAYPKVSATYTISDEAFWPTSLVETFKLRAAWGASGKAPGVFEAEKLWEATAADEQEPAVVIDNFGNPDLGPERSEELELGFDASAFEGRVSVEFTWYDQTTKNALIEVPAAASTGTNNPIWSNLGEVDNWGTETSLNVVPIRTDDVEWSVGAQYTSNDSKVIDLGGLTELGGTNIQPDLPMQIAWDAILQNPGEVGVAPVLEDGMIGRLFPTDIVALSTRVTLWQSLTLDVLGEGQYGMVRPVGHAYQNMRRTSPDNPAWPYCSPILARWTAGGATNAERIANSGLTTDEIAECVDAYSDQGIWTRSADFFKLRSATVSWRVPEGWVPGARSVMVSLQGKNLFTLSDYVGLDPEAADNGIDDETPNDYYTFGPPRTFILGVSVSF